MREKRTLNRRVRKLSRIVFVVIFVAIIQLQLVARSSQSHIVRAGGNANGTTPDSLPAAPSPRPDADLVMPLPFVNRSARRSDVNDAVGFLRLPTWSHGYSDCDSGSSEVSCFEIVRAAETLRAWETLVSKKKTQGHVWVQIRHETFGDCLSMVYHGLQIAASTGRDLYVDHSKLRPIALPTAVKDSQNVMLDGYETRTDHLFGCIDISSRNPRIKFSGATWPQVMYTHVQLSGWLREHFSFHAAYLMGNYLFGNATKPSDHCLLREPMTAIEGFRFLQSDMLHPREFPRVLERCGVNAAASLIVTNSQEQISGVFREIVQAHSAKQEDTVCHLRMLVSARRIIHTFGSRFGFWATALRGAGGAFVNSIDKICVNMSNSQQGSIWHTFCPEGMSEHIFRTNSRLYVCGSTTDDIKLYVQYLLW